MTDEEDADWRYVVLVNSEEQYSLWQADIEVPGGWKKVHGPQSKEACLSYVEEVWTDMRPLSLRRRMEGDPPSEG